MRWQDCEAHIFWGDDEVKVTLRHMPSKIGLVKRFVPSAAAIRWFDLYTELDKELSIHMRSKF